MENIVIKRHHHHHVKHHHRRHKHHHHHGKYHHLKHHHGKHHRKHKHGKHHHHIHKHHKHHHGKHHHHKHKHHLKHHHGKHHKHHHGKHKHGKHHHHKHHHHHGKHKHHHEKHHGSIYHERAEGGKVEIKRDDHESKHETKSGSKHETKKEIKHETEKVVKHEIKKDTKHETEKVVKQETKSESKTTTPAVREHFCTSSGDPHFSTFNSTKYDFYKVGDWTLVKSRHFRVDARTKPWNSVAVNTAFACYLNEDRDIVQSVDSGHFYVNDRLISINVGETKNIKHGGKINRYSENSVKVYGASGSYVDATFYNEENNKWPQPLFVNLIVQVHNPEEVTGMCVSQNYAERAEGVFRHNYNPGIHPSPKKTFTEDEKNDAFAKCKEANVKDRHVNMCMEDILFTGKSIHINADSTKKLEDHMCDDQNKLQIKMKN